MQSWENIKYIKKNIQIYENSNHLVCFIPKGALQS